MTREECIGALKGSMDLFLIDPSTGEEITPEQLNDMNRMTYDAMEYAVRFMESRPRVGRHSYFYTFGTDPRFPFGPEEYVEVHADTANQANQKFKNHFPNRPGSGILNCAWVYSETAWEKVRSEYYSSKQPARVID